MASIDPSDLLSHAGWLRQLARSLVSDGADDLVQDTWLAALRRPPRSEGSLRPWLRAVLTNAARLRWRGDANRDAREHAVADLADGEVPSAEQLLERHELQQVLARLVRELDEPFRSTILLRFGEGLTPTQIARRLGIPAGTVRWRLKEALDRLRAELDALHRGDRRAWMLALAPLAAPRPAATAPTVPVGIAAGAACALVVFVVVVMRAGAPPPAPPASTPRGPAAVIRRTAPTSPSDVAWLAQEGAPARSLTGRVRLVGGAPAAGALVRLIADPLPAREIRTDETGRFDFGEQLPREYSLGASAPGTLAAIQHVDLRDPGAPRDIELVLGDCVTSLYGRVVDASGTPIQGAQVLREGVVGTETDATGTYELCALPTAALTAELRVVVRADGFGTLVMDLAPPGRMHRDFVLAPEASISGRVVGADGSPMPDARVSLRLTGPEASVPPERGISISALTDPEGAFRLGGLAAGEYSLAASSAHAVAPAIVVQVEAAEHRTVEVRTVSTGVLRGRVVSRGRPVAGVNVAAGEEHALSQPDGSFVLARVPVGDVELTTAPYRRTSGVLHIVEGDRNSAEIIVEPLGVIRGTVRRHGVPVPYARVGIAGPSKAGLTTDAAGRYEANGLEAGTYSFYCDDRRRSAMVTEDPVFELGAGETREHDIELVWGGTISGHVVDARGNPVEGAMVWFRAGMASHCLTDASGAFTCSSLAGGTYAATVFPSDGGANAFRFIEAPATFELRDGDARLDGVRLVVEPTLLAIAGKVVDDAGMPVADVAVHAVGVERKPRFRFQPAPPVITDDDGRFRIPDLSPGDYLVEVERRGLATRQTLAAGARDVTLVLDRPPCAAARGHEMPATFIRPPAPVVWDQAIELVGWSLPPTTRVDATVELTLIYRVRKPVDRDWTIFAHFDSTSLRVNADHEPAIGWCPTKQWQPNDTIVDRATVRFDRPGTYALTIGFFTGKAPTWHNLAISTAPAAMHDIQQQGVHLGDVLVTN